MIYFTFFLGIGLWHPLCIYIYDTSWVRPTTFQMLHSPTGQEALLGGTELDQEFLKQRSEFYSAFAWEHPGLWWASSVGASSILVRYLLLPERVWNACDGRVSYSQGCKCLEISWAMRQAKWGLRCMAYLSAPGAINICAVSRETRNLACYVTSSHFECQQCVWVTVSLWNTNGND